MNEIFATIGGVVLVLSAHYLRRRQLRKRYGEYIALGLVAGVCGYWASSIFLLAEFFGVPVPDALSRQQFTPALHIVAAVIGAHIMGKFNNG